MIGFSRGVTQKETDLKKLKYIKFKYIKYVHLQYIHCISYLSNQSDCISNISYSINLTNITKKNVLIWCFIVFYSKEE